VEAQGALVNHFTKVLHSVNLAAGNGTNGRGEGGGGGVTTAARGGSGVVIISYTDPSTNQVIATQPSSQTVGRWYNQLYIKCSGNCKQWRNNFLPVVQTNNAYSNCSDFK